MYIKNIEDNFEHVLGVKPVYIAVHYHNQVSVVVSSLL